MRMFILFLLSVCSFSSLYAQDSSSRKILDRGIALHDREDYEGAIKIYDELIKADKKYYLAYYEKCFSLYSMGKYEDCIDLCKQILKDFPDGSENTNVYVNYGTSLDMQGKRSEAIKIYDKGIKRYPDFYLLPFNKAITESSDKDYDAAIEDLKTSVSLNPHHASSHIYLAYLVKNKNRMASVMALSTSLLIETQGTRTFKNLGILEDLLGNNVTQKDDKTINVTLNAEPEKGSEDDFSKAESAMSMKTAANYIVDEKIHQSSEQKLKGKLESLSLTDLNQKGFFTHFYLPFFIELKSEGMLETACYIIYASSGNKDNKQWLADNQEKIKAFYKWMNAYKWKKD